MKAKTRATPLKLVVLNEVGSTQTAVKAWAAQGVACVGLLAQAQTAGRGRRGTVWASPPGGFYFSYAQPWSERSGLPLSLRAGVVLTELLREQWAIDAWLKWPNDVYVGDRKLAGVLTELAEGEAGPVAVLGIGLNRLPVAGGELAQAAVSLAELLPSIPSVEVMATAWMRLWQREETHHEWLERFIALDRLRGRQVSLRMGDQDQEGVVQGYSPEGELQLQTAQGTLHCQEGIVHFTRW